MDGCWERVTLIRLAWEGLLCQVNVNRIEVRFLQERCIHSPCCATKLACCHLTNYITFPTLIRSVYCTISCIGFHDHSHIFKQGSAKCLGKRPCDLVGEATAFLLTAVVRTYTDLGYPPGRQQLRRISTSLCSTHLESAVGTVILPLVNFTNPSIYNDFTNGLRLPLPPSVAPVRAKSLYISLINRTINRNTNNTHMLSCMGHMSSFSLFYSLLPNLGTGKQCCDELRVS